MTEAWITAAFRERSARGIKLEGEMSHIWEVEEEWLVPRGQGAQGLGRERAPWFPGTRVLSLVATNKR